MMTTRKPGCHILMVYHVPFASYSHKVPYGIADQHAEPSLIPCLALPV